ncbi:MAG: DNA methylase [Cellvibrionales bacterium]|nr:DNA methylase [Cellvibrionales bacterium]
MTQSLFSEENKPSGPVECLGQTFPSENARREHFLNLLAEKLKDPEFRKIEGFPIGTDEAILAMSDPPYYTACPNPFLEDFVHHYGKPYDPSVKYSREPQTIDVSIGKSDPIYKAHSYHTKVPHLAIVPSILHYTEPGDIVLDGFCGSGMTGVAAQWCGGAPAAYRHELESEWKMQGKTAPKWGARRVILNDLSPAATFIAANYNLPFEIHSFLAVADKILQDLRSELGWMYSTNIDGKVGDIDFTVWSEIFTCPDCAGEIVFHDHALDDESKRVKDSFHCPHCGSVLGKNNLELAFDTIIDSASNKPKRQPRRKPVLIKLTCGSKKYTKNVDASDIENLRKIANISFPKNAPNIEFPDMQMMRVGRMKTTNVIHVHDLFLPRTMQVLSRFFEKVNEVKDAPIRKALKIIAQHQFVNASLMNRYRPASSFGNSPLTGVFYVSSLVAEANVFDLLRGSINRIKRMEKSAWGKLHGNGDSVVITSGNAACLNGVLENSIDYIFTDPPFGENIYYSDLNFLVESWYGVISDSGPEAIVDRVKKKGVPEYQQLMQRCFNEYYRVLKPGRWMTVVFSNSRAAVWNAIQVALQQAGFVVAEVSTLDKVHLSFQQVMSPNAVKQDLVISVYKPNGGLEDRFNQNGATADSAWDFVQTHLKQLPIVKTSGGDFQELMHVVERDPRRIYDRMASWFIRHGAMVPINTPEFLSELPLRYAERDGMVFLSDQVVEYDKKRQQIPQIREMELFVSDERSAIDWLTNFLKKKPSTYSEIHPEYIPVVGAAKKKGEIIPELSQLLEDNFIQYDGKEDVPSQIHSLLSTNFKDLRGLEKNDPRLMSKAKDRWYVPDPNKAQDLEKKREKALLKEFEGYRTHTGKRMKDFRLEVLRAGFKTAWGNKDYKTIIDIAAKIPEEALQEDEKLLLWYDQALTRSETGI